MMIGAKSRASPTPRVKLWKPNIAPQTAVTRSVQICRADVSVDDQLLLTTLLVKLAVMAAAGDDPGALSAAFATF